MGDAGRHNPLTGALDLTFDQHVFKTMIQHCLESRPLEACGLLSGKNDQGATTIFPMINILQKPDRFEMDPKQIREVLQHIKSKSNKLVGIYHSHPTAPPYPSKIDVAYANYPEVVYIIVSLMKPVPEVRCFRIVNHRIIPIQHRVM
ncbi:M67 family metallopeptidase [Thermoactinomyces sp. DSM 45892]|uniref:M67 family metallopeptidase n=1 Tax=Thermoactinomyces sp. DSM 45892 TaxID=1882753 RepID=UPI000898D4AB|nr:M67 family metallopeptidase [Thermoactinomyces sp. DSM 45892]SDZ36169.1 Proteasome lid subunit RPN8/RPN11, contains Jab1/MPN metalloenzyme (JAMM) motif [Thermoactinomyces sp. DSM 45892]